MKFALPLAALIASGCGSPAPRPPLPAPDLPAQVDDLRVRLAHGRERVAFYQGAAHADRVARLHFADLEAAAMVRVEIPRQAPVAGMKQRPASFHLESTETRSRDARFEAVAGPAHLVNVDSEPGAAEVSRRASRRGGAR